jgi:hypothetical protein
MINSRNGVAYPNGAVSENGIDLLPGITGYKEYLPIFGEFLGGCRCGSSKKQDRRQM